MTTAVLAAVGDAFRSSIVVSHERHRISGLYRQIVSPEIQIAIPIAVRSAVSFESALARINS
jgi:hypothetical protein